MHQFLLFSPEVASARSAGKPVVALESTIISHGMPYPQNVDMAREVEQVIRDAGAVPATIAIMDGRICVGLGSAQLELLGNSPDAMKVSRRDLPYVLATRRLGATTVAATMICAQMADIKVFVTGGIGGVHRGGATSFDISADLLELARTNVAVVCAGVKSILDIGLTLEYLETHGVPVISVGQPGFPAFFTRESGFNADFQLDTALQQANFIQTKWSLGLDGGVVIGNPVPAMFEMPSDEIGRITEQALAEAGSLGISGKAVTPFLLDRIKTLTEGRSLMTNIALVKHNALVGAQLAVAMHDLPGMKPI
ncbi:pseudouridine-5'-phosphate glycosidase [Massilia glaciei]|uniref:Pseudouridine-5'-phosphate glycosidase n=1 Tax=Massilia glaciei TaxID=1524097 RepID=A0A2U2H8R8_9BURK|nr:pseudouridine-5'-phosphate glycosidase [Massilia glaciei]PWF39003.1 pseudouridine-5'-phosphate glycosidase [Massilia glaciei]